MPKLYHFLSSLGLQDHFPKLNEMRFCFEDFITMPFDRKNDDIVAVLQSIVTDPTEFEAIKDGVSRYNEKKRKKIEKENGIKMEQRTQKYLSVFEKMGIRLKHQILYKDISLLDSFAKGIFGALFKVLYQDTVCAAKKMVVKNEARLMIIANEIKLLLSCDHEHIVSCYGFCIDPESNSVYIITELCDTQNLYDVLHRKNQTMTRLKKTRFVQEIYAAMCYLHDPSINIAHRDLKSKNVLLQNSRLKLCDFGSAGFKNEISNSLKGSPHNTPPELMQSNGKLFKKIDHELLDIYAFGGLMYEIWTGITPHENFKGEEGRDIRFEILSKVRSGDLTLDFTKLRDISFTLKKLIRCCCDHNKSKRPKRFVHMKDRINNLEAMSTL